ncbi:MAG: UvrD-helicase domain-containing protein [Defluviitaleaceae bacterium]|nr:UvrD-helicase domain-containing protein [Defluviitaleaceae bacterium]
MKTNTKTGVKSNIKIASNIFNRRNAELNKDPEFMAQVEHKRKMHTNYIRCKSAHNGEITHGLIRKDNGEYAIEGRCEYFECSDFLICKETAKYSRDTPQIQENIQPQSAPLKYKWLGDIENIFDKKGLEGDDASAEPYISDEASFATVEAYIKEYIRELVKDYVKIDSPQKITEGDIENQVLVNAAPGGGKTHTVISRIEHIIRNKLVNDFANILVITYTNATKNNILEGLEDCGVNGSVPHIEKNVNVYTIDSLASAKVDFSNLEYIIVDELQYMANENMGVILDILSATNSGFLLLSDKSRFANINSVGFYKRLQEILSQNVSKYDLVGNRRQVPNLATISEKFREAMLDFTPDKAKEVVFTELKNIKTIGKPWAFDFENINEPTAILCATDGEAEYVSHHIHGKGVLHTLLRSGPRPVALNRFIADCLWDYHGNTKIPKTTFVKRYCARVSDDKKAANEAFEALSYVTYEHIDSYVEDTENIDIDLLAQKLCIPTLELPAALLSEDNAMITVSTIPNARGREFHTVLLFADSFNQESNTTEEAQAWYSAFTRARYEVHKLGKPKSYYFKPSATNQLRWTQFSKPVQKGSICKKIALGLPMDFSYEGFVSGDFASALKIQEYIAEKISVGDSVDIVLEDETYYIKHEKNIIGNMSKNIYNQLLKIVRETKPFSPAPPFMSKVYVTDIVTNIVTMTPSNFAEETTPYFKESKFWLGLELSGFPEIDWKKDLEYILLKGNH